MFVLRNTRYNINTVVAKVVNPSLISTTKTHHSNKRSEQDYVSPHEDVNVVNQVKIHNNPFAFSSNNPEREEAISNMENLKQSNGNSVASRGKADTKKMNFTQGNYPEYKLLDLLKIRECFKHLLEFFSLIVI